MNNLLKYIYIIILTCLNLNVFSLDLKKKIEYNFICIGHAYGAHYNQNIALDPTLLKHLNNFNDLSCDFIVFTGDIIRGGTESGWIEFENQMNTINKPFFCVLGNNDNTKYGKDFFLRKFKSTYYSRKIMNDMFIILDSQKDELSISKDQISFLKTTIEESDSSINNWFIFFHELLWNSNFCYASVKSNKRSRFNSLYRKSNFWTDLYPILHENSHKNFYVITGDVSGNKDAIPAFFEKKNNVTLISSGIGEVDEENILIVSVEDSIVNFKLSYLNDDYNKKINYFTKENLVNYYNPKKIKKKLVDKILNRIKNNYFIDGLIVGTLLIFAMNLGIKYLKKRY